MTTGGRVTDRIAVVAVAAALVLFLTSNPRAQDSSAAAAQTSVEAWLSLVDTQKYAASWEAAASVFKSAVTEEQWSAAVQKVRASLGQVKSRVLKSATAVKPPNAPEGEYLVFQFDTSLELRASSAAEMVTAFKEKDGTWRVAGYFIK